MGSRPEGIEQVFADVVTLAENCRFNDCKHDTEPGCAVQAAITEGKLNAKRLKRWKKLDAEEAHNSASIAERRVKDKAFGKKIKKALNAKKRYS